VLGPDACVLTVFCCLKETLFGALANGIQKLSVKFKPGSRWSQQEVMSILAETLLWFLLANLQNPQPPKPAGEISLGCNELTIDSEKVSLLDSSWQQESKSGMRNYKVTGRFCYLDCFLEYYSQIRQTLIRVQVCVCV
jgi:hypothetical protein